MITKDTTLGELAEILRALPRGTRLILRARSSETKYKPAHFSVTVEPGLTDFKTTAHALDLAVALDAALSNHTAELLKTTLHKGD